jgi:hypothetical protein
MGSDRTLNHSLFISYPAAPPALFRARVLGTVCVRATTREMYVIYIVSSLCSHVHVTTIAHYYPLRNILY